MGKKTQDGLSLADILMKAAMQAGIGIRKGGKRPYALEYPNMRPCPIAASTHAKRMVVPWMAQVLGREKNEIYTALRRGYWPTNPKEKKMQETEIKTKIAGLRAKYTKLALNCKAAGIRVNPETVQEYIKEIQELQAMLN